tara:strand:- start:38 stop:328 length:291 start_codon:yes stop_codon:yes gene_type:complete
MPSEKRKKQLAKARAKASRVRAAKVRAATEAARAAEAKAETQKSSENIQLVVEDKQKTKKVTINPELNSVKTYTPDQLIPKVKYSAKHVGTMAFTF